MSLRQNPQPPRWATKFLSWYCRPELLEDLEGDLHEYFDRHVQSKGIRQAKLIYIIDVFKFFRSYTVRKPEFINLLIHWIMIGSYIKTSGRSIVRNKMFSTINIFGLAISMSVGLLLIAFLSDLYSYDRFHAKGERIYRVIDTHTNEHRRPIELASTSIAVGRRIEEDYAGIEDIVILRQGFSADIEANEKKLSLQGLWSDESFFDVFSFKLLKGNPKTVLKEPYSIVLTEKEAARIFGTEEALGKAVKVRDDSEKDGTDYIVTGIMQDVPIFSHLRFESLISLSTLDISNKDDKDYLRWQNVWSNYVYVVIPENTSAANLQKFLDEQAKIEDAKVEHEKISFELQPLYSIALGKDLSNQVGPTMLSLVMWIIGALAFVVILSACFNYTNLSIARSMRRSREVGIRKVIGALRSHVVGQFIAEAVIISLLALAFSVGLFFILRPAFLSLASELSAMVTLELSWAVVGYFVVLAIAVGLLAGILPALFFARIKAVQVLKDASSLKVFKNVALRKVLIVTQYALSLAFIATTLIGYKQYKYFLAFDLGFRTENIVNINLQDNKPEVIASALAEIPEISQISKSLMVTSIGSYYGTRVKYNGDSLDLFYNTVNEHYLPMHGHAFVAGNNFDAKPDDRFEQQVIVNEKFVTHFKIGSPEKALGEIISIDTNQFRIVGVLKDFHYGKVDSKIDPFMLKYSNSDVRFLNAVVNSDDWVATMARIEETWKKIDPVHPLEATFYNDEIEKAYSQFSVMIKIIGFLATLAIIIASIGLLGMVVFTTETRTKEISIRKVLGASEGNLIYLLSRGFFVLLFIAAVIALPATYLLFDQVILQQFVYKAPIGMIELFAGLLGILVIAILMIVSQTVRVARANPATVLKAE